MKLFKLVLACLLLVAWEASSAADKTAAPPTPDKSNVEFHNGDWVYLVPKDAERQNGAGKDKGETAKPVPPPEPFVLQAGISLEQQLQGWAKRAQWTVSWNIQQDWVVPGGSSFGPNFEKAISHVVEALAKNGADVRADIYPANHTVVIHQAGALE